LKADDTRYTSDITAYDPSVRAETAAGSLPTLGTQIGKRDIIIPESYVETLGKKPSDMLGKTITIRVQRAIVPPSSDEIQAAFLRGGASEAAKLVERESRDEVFTISAVSARSSTTLSASAALFISDVAAQELSNYITEGTAQFEKYITATVLVKDGVEPTDVKKAAEDAGMVARTAKDLRN
jgi:hypothetical protein